MVGVFENQPDVNFVREHHNVAVADGGGDVAHVSSAKHATGGVLRRVEDYQPGAIRYQIGELVHVEPEIEFLAQADRHGLSTHEANHGLVNGEAGIRIYDLVSLIN